MEEETKSEVAEQAEEPVRTDEAEVAESIPEKDPGEDRFDIEDPDDWGIEADPGDEDGGDEKAVPVEEGGSGDDADALVSLAVKYGLDEEFAKKQQEAGLLADLLNRMQPGGDDEPAAGGGQADEWQDVDIDGLVKRLEEDYEPELVEAIKGLAAVAKRGLENERRMSSWFQSQTQEAFENRFDSMVSGLGDEYAELLGKDDRKTIDRRTRQFANRIELVNQMNVLAEAHLKAEGRVPGERELFDEALRLKFGKEVEKVKERKLARKVDARKAYMTPKSREVETFSPQGEVAAVRNVESLLRSWR